MHRSMTRRALLVLAVAGAAAPGLSGCATGASEFQCPDHPQGMPCTSTRQVYKATDGASTGATKKADKGAADGNGGGDTETSASQDAQPSKADQAAKRGHPQTAAGTQLPVRQRNRIPVREPAKVMRVWVAPWEDENGALHMSGLIYTEIVERRWNIGNPAPGASGVTQPLKAPGVANPERSQPQVQRQGQSGSDSGQQSQSTQP